MKLEKDGSSLIPRTAKIDLKAGCFIANNTKYYVQDSLAMGRWKPYQQQQHVLAFNGTPEDHLKFVDFVVKILSGPISGMAIHKILENAINIQGMYKSFISDDIDHWFRFAALFVNREGEDIAAWDEKVVQSKIYDWKVAGLDMQDFFLLCARQSKALRVKFQQSPHLLIVEEEE